MKSKSIVLMLVALAALSVPLASSAEARSKPSASCLEALDQSERLAAQMTEVLGASQTFFEALGENADTNDYSPLAFVTQLTEDVKTFSATIGDLTPGTHLIATKYGSAAAKCRAGR